MRWRILATLWLALSYSLALADEIALNPQHPETYVVAPGDTLWDIAARFLQNPWEWPLIWHDNPSIKDPHWIYPGDVLALSFVEGQPQLQVAQRAEEEKLSPRVRSTPLAQVIPSIPMNIIQQFLTRPKVVEAGEMQYAPYIIAVADEHIIGGAGDRIYARGLADQNMAGYIVFRSGKKYADYETGETLGYEALYVGNAQMQDFDEVSTLLLTETSRETLMGDRLLPVEEDRLTMRYVPHAPKHRVQGHIIDVLDGVSQIGQYQVVIIDRGEADGLEVGNVLQVFQSNFSQRDNVTSYGGALVQLPKEKAGYMMIFRAYNRVSFALVTKAIRAIHLHDAFSSP
jgi:hypothetical protein